MIYTVIDCDDYIGIYGDDRLVSFGERYCFDAEGMLRLTEYEKVEFFGSFEVCSSWWDSLPGPAQLPKDLEDVHLNFEGESLPFYDYLEKKNE